MLAINQALGNIKKCHDKISFIALYNVKYGTAKVVQQLLDFELTDNKDQQIQEKLKDVNEKEKKKSFDNLVRQEEERQLTTKTKKMID